jgi:hypothetical protein
MCVGLGGEGEKGLSWCVCGGKNALAAVNHLSAKKIVGTMVPGGGKG